ncbi:MAG: ISNCY family transposase [Pseudonocardiaceae bacterium]
MRPGPARQVSFADIELAAQPLPLDPLLEAIATFLDTHAECVGLVHQDLVRGLKQPGTGRTGLSAVQTLRAFALQRIKHWDLRELRARIADGLTLRRFTTFDGQAVPSHTAFHRAFTRLTPATVRALNAAVVRAAITLGLEDGTRLRVDTTVVETDIHHPTDSTLLWDGVRVLTRLVGQLGALVPAATQGCVNHTRRARRRMQEISRLTPAQRPRRQRRKYCDLLTVTTVVLTQARAAATAARTLPLSDPLAAATVQGLRAEIERVGGLVDRVIAQTQRRVLQGEAVPAADKILSIFEPHTDLIVRGKARTPAEFGHKVFLAESGAGLITDYQILAGNPADEAHVGPSLERHRGLFDTVPTLYAGDRGFHTPANATAITAAGVRTECLPQRGGHKTPARAAYEKTRAFKRGQRFRAGIEGRISVLFRGRGMKRCLLTGPERFDVFVGLAVLANNLLRIADLLKHPARRRRRAA